MKLARLLWQANISAEYSHQDNPTLKKQMNEVLERYIPFMIVFGTDELSRGTVKVKDILKHTEIEVTVDGLVACLLSHGCPVIPQGADLSFLDSMRTIETVEASEE